MDFIYKLLKQMKKAYIIGNKPHKRRKRQREIFFILREEQEEHKEVRNVIEIQQKSLSIIQVVTTTLDRKTVAG